jgi:16S rRNA (cytosine967-C5)-methyltransferase
VNTRAGAALILNSLPKNWFGYETQVASFAVEQCLDQTDQDFIYILVKGVIQYQKRLDYILQSVVRRRLNKLEPLALNLLRLGTFQADFLKTASHALVHETVEAARQLQRKDLCGFVNGVLRHLPSEEQWQKQLKRLKPVWQLAVLYSHPEWLVSKWYKLWGRSDTEKLLNFNNQYKQISFRLHPVHQNWANLKEHLESADFEVQILAQVPLIYFIVDQPGHLLKSDFFKRGCCSVQDYSQAFAVWLLDPQPGEHILDVCAAPGGKTTMIQQLTGNRSLVIASDTSEEKLELLRQELVRLELNNIQLRQADATTDEYPLSDKILFDAPCSGTGVLARRADLRWQRNPLEIEQAQGKQLQILRHVSQFVKVQGLLVYSTCSLESEENEQVIRQFLAENPNFTLEPAQDIIPRQYCSAEGYVRIWPHIHGLMGSFAARLCRR